MAKAEDYLRLGRNGGKHRNHKTRAGGPVHSPPSRPPLSKAQDNPAWWWPVDHAGRHVSPGTGGAVRRWLLLASLPGAWDEPRSNSEYWGPKLDRNVVRDRDTEKQLRQLGWLVVRGWEHESHETIADRVEAAVTRRSSL